METQSGQQKPVPKPQPAPPMGAPATYAAHAVRRDVSVRVSIRAPLGDGEELREDGYGHGV